MLFRRRRSCSNPARRVRDNNRSSNQSTWSLFDLSTIYFNSAHLLSFSPCVFLSFSHSHSQSLTDWQRVQAILWCHSTVHESEKKTKEDKRPAKGGKKKKEIERRSTGSGPGGEATSRADVRDLLIEPERTKCCWLGHHNQSDDHC